MLARQNSLQTIQAAAERVILEESRAKEQAAAWKVSYSKRIVCLRLAFAGALCMAALHPVGQDARAPW